MLIRTSDGASTLPSSRECCRRVAPPMRNHPGPRRAVAAKRVSPLGPPVFGGTAPQSARMWLGDQQA